MVLDDNESEDIRKCTHYEAHHNVRTQPVTLPMTVASCSCLCRYMWAVFTKTVTMVTVSTRGLMVANTAERFTWTKKKATEHLPLQMVANLK